MNLSKQELVGFVEGFLTVWITGMTGVVGTTWATPPLMAWVLITAGGVLAGFRYLNALQTNLEEKKHA